MIVLTRIDYRLLHGQVVYAWINFTNADCILIADDTVVNDEFRKKALKLAKPENCKLVFKNIQEAAEALNSGVTDKYKLCIILQTVDDAYRLCKKTDVIKEINFGLSQKKEGSKAVSKAVYVNEEEKQKLIEMMQKGVHIYLQQGPRDSLKSLEDIL